MISRFVQQKRKSSQVITCFAAAVMTLPAHATTYAVLPTVTVSGIRIEFDPGTYYFPSSDFIYSELHLNPHEHDDRRIIAMNQAILLSDMCTFAKISPDLASTTAGSGGETRWLAAQYAFNAVVGARLLSSYNTATNNLSFLMNGVTYRGFKVKYADGSTEVWPINPGHATSVVKLLDTPMPNSLNRPAAPRQSCEAAA